MTTKDLLFFTKMGWFMAAWLATFLLNATWSTTPMLANVVGTVVTLGAWLVWVRVLVLRVGSADEED